MAYTTPEETNGTNISQALEFNLSSTSSSLPTLPEILVFCNKQIGTSIKEVIPQILVLLFALPANGCLLFSFLKNRKTLSPSEVLGLNLALLGVVYCFGLPLDMYITIKGRLGIPVRISNTFAVLVYTGCPLLLTSMCLERYVAVSHPVLFIKLGRWQYRAACSATIWIFTSLMAMLTFTYSLGSTAIYLSFILNVLFLIMVACLLAIVCVLCKTGPGDDKSGEKKNSPQKKRALKNIVFIIVPSTIVYIPLLGMAPFLLLVRGLTEQSIIFLICKVLYTFGVIPYFGICIGPFFYVARIRQMICIRKNDVKDKKSTTVDEKNPKA